MFPNVLSYHFPDLIEHTVDDFFSNSVVPASVVIRRILFTADQLLRVEQLSVVPSANHICMDKAGIVWIV